MRRRMTASGRFLHLAAGFRRCRAASRLSSVLRSATERSPVQPLGADQTAGVSFTRPTVVEMADSHKAT